MIPDIGEAGRTTASVKRPLNGNELLVAVTGDRDGSVMTMVWSDASAIALEALKPGSDVLPTPLCVAELGPPIKVGGPTPECSRGVDGGCPTRHPAASV